MALDSLTLSYQPPKTWCQAICCACGPRGGQVVFSYDSTTYNPNARGTLRKPTGTDFTSFMKAAAANFGQNGAQSMTKIEIKKLNIEIDYNAIGRLFPNAVIFKGSRQVSPLKTA
jgi:hypothetical protein